MRSRPRLKIWHLLGSKFPGSFAVRFFKCGHFKRKIETRSYCGKIGERFTELQEQYIEALH